MFYTMDPSPVVSIKFGRKCQSVMVTFRCFPRYIGRELEGKGKQPKPELAPVQDASSTDANLRHHVTTPLTDN